MEFLGQRTRFGLEVFLGVLSTTLLVFYYLDSGYPDGYVLIGVGTFLIYVVAQFFTKLGLTVPFAFIVFWMVVAIKEWNNQQAVSSFNVEDYMLAIASVLYAVNGVVIYFENKTRW